MSHRERNVPPAVEWLEPRTLLSAAPLDIPDLESRPERFTSQQQSAEAAEARRDRLSSLAVGAGNGAGVSAFGRIGGADVREAAVQQVEQLLEHAAGQANALHVAPASRLAVSDAVDAERQAEQETIRRGESPIWQVLSTLPNDTVVQRIAESRIGNQVDASLAMTGLAVRARLAGQAGNLTPQSPSGLGPLRAGLSSAASVRPSVPGMGGSSARLAMATLLVNADTPAGEVTGVQETVGSSWPDSFLPGSVWPGPLAPLEDRTVPRESSSSQTSPWMGAAVSDLENDDGGYERSPDSILSLDLARVAMGISQFDSLLDSDALERNEETSASRMAGLYRGDFGTANDPETGSRVELVDENADLRLPLRRHEPTIRRIGDDLVSDSEENSQDPDEATDPPPSREIVASATPSIRTLDLELDDSEPATAGMIAFVGFGAAGDGNSQGKDAARELPHGEGSSNGFQHEPILIDGLCGRASAFEVEAAADAVAQVEDESAQAPGGETSGSEIESSNRLPGDSAAPMSDTILAPQMPPVEAADTGFLSVLIVSGMLHTLFTARTARSSRVTAADPICPSLRPA